MIPVTKPFLPPKEEYFKYLEGVWERNWLTNNGPLVNELELKLKEYLGVPHILYLTNGTIALQIAIKALGLKGEVITTPFTYVATVSSLIWEGCTPVFVDIDPDTLNIDPTKIEGAITERTTGILATHVYGNPCDIDAIDTIAKKHNLKVIYDAAHCFGTKYKGKSVFNYGDVTTTSFHATKLFHTVEGGAVFTQDPELLKKMAFMRNFGHNGPDDFAEIGINGKNSEFHAAMGLINLNYIEKIFAKRKALTERYFKWLSKNDLQTPQFNKFSSPNYAYFPIIFKDENTLLKVIKALELNWVYTRRYFYPSLSSFSIFNGSECKVSDDVSKRILCLPLYTQLKFEEVDFVCRIILRVLNN
ncbi:aminotransferase DegT [Thermaurantimonas aggregans]|uniref:Aminotransferase DegT n=1 Tax=Thermaurantimonas aggregans TaxID=2173829 RepID=A0A401XK47_9FLAO|nr:DegT/DnrJ/EryC1/StrS family aminotransferase [Thermaurantimonas aggregans]GCD77354.1 aminotransferase DegT [Thermaurantimonas aggregans]